MQNLRAFFLFLLSFTVLTSFVVAETTKEKKDKLKSDPAVHESSKAAEKSEDKIIAEKAKDDARTEPVAAPVVQQLVELVDIQGNRRLRDDDLLYYIQTRPGDVYNQAQLERDLKELLSLNFFDKTETRVLTEPGVRGGVNVIFEVRELPIIRDLQFDGIKAVSESDILKAFREQRVGISKEAVFDPVNAQKGVRVLRELLAARGFPNATVKIEEEEVSATSIALTFNVDQGNRSRIVDIEFEGNENFSDGELRNQLQLVKETGLISRFKEQDILDIRKLEYDLQKNVRSYMFSKGYFQARIGDPEVVGLGYKRTGFIPYLPLPIPLLTSKDDTLRIIIPVSEGKVFRVGELKVEGNSIFSDEQILAIVGLKKGEIADGKRLQDAVFEDLKKLYGSQGFVLYDAEFIPEFKDNSGNPEEGLVDITLNIDEGRQFRLRRLNFTGNTFTRDNVLRREFLLNEGDIYNQIALERSIIRINQLQYFDPVNKDEDVETRTDQDQGDVDVIVKVRERGRQQISVNGGVSGIGGSFFGLEYSTNNLLGRGETLSLQFGLGNRQQSFQFTFQNPYFLDRPIAVGFTAFASRFKFFGQGTFLSQNQDVILGALSQQGQLTVDTENLFTQNTYGASVFATAPLSEFFFRKRQFTQFSRIGLSYQFSATSVDDPPINETNPDLGIPIIFEQPSIITSRVTGSFVYDTRQPTANGIDTLRGTQISASVALAGLGGDVRTYQPSISYTQFIPIRNKNSDRAEVFGFRIQAGTIGSFAISDKIKNANSLSFVGGVPIFERYFLGSEFDIRGYEVRSIGPIAPVNTYITSQNVVAATNFSGDITPIPGLSDRTAAELAQYGIFTGPDGTNPALLSNSFQFIGGDTQLLGNFEYRVPIFGPLSMAAFADIGAVFNLRNTGIQRIDSTFLQDDIFIGAGVLSTLAVRENPGLQGFTTGFTPVSLLLSGDQAVTRSEFRDFFCSQPLRFGCAVPLNGDVQQFFLRGDVQTNQLIDVDNSAFNKIGDFRSSVGVELRIQVPVVNVPFRLIFFYNPSLESGFVEGIPGLFLRGNKSSGMRFSVGRTF